MTRDAWQTTRVARVMTHSPWLAGTDELRATILIMA